MRFTMSTVTQITRSCTVITGLTSGGFTLGTNKAMTYIIGAAHPDDGKT